jgi:hypothetical protein
MLILMLVCTTVALIAIVFAALLRPSSISRPFAVALLITSACVAASLMLKIFQSGAGWSQGKLIVAVLSTGNASAIAGILLGWLARSLKGGGAGKCEVK